MTTEQIIRVLAALSALNEARQGIDAHHKAFPATWNGEKYVRQNVPAEDLARLDHFYDLQDAAHKELRKLAAEVAP